MDAHSLSGDKGQAMQGPYVERLRLAIGAGQAGIWIETHEPNEVVLDMHRLLAQDAAKRGAQNELRCWNFAEGEMIFSSESLSGRQGADNRMPLHQVLKRWLDDAAADDAPQRSVMLVMNPHLRWSPETIQQMYTAIMQGRKCRRFLVVLAPHAQVPLELRRAFYVVEHDLPSREALAEILQASVEGLDPVPELPDELRERVLDTAVGLTSFEAESAFAMSLSRRKGQIDPQDIFDYKAANLKTLGGSLSVFRSDVRFADIGGMEFLKQFCLDLLGERHTDPKLIPRGIVLAGVSGSGKSLFAKALGNEVGRPCLRVDFSSVKASLVGQSEANLREMLRRVEKMSPCVLWWDELEKALAGIQGSVSDGGLSANLVGKLLEWLNDRTCDSFIVMTVNDVRVILNQFPELLRPGRLDAMFFVDFPSRDVRRKIWEIHRQAYGLEEQPLPEDEGWTGAQIESCCRLARLRRMSLREVGQCMPTLTDQAGDVIDAARAWADGRCYSTETATMYRYQRATTSRKKPLDHLESGRRF